MGRGSTNRCALARRLKLVFSQVHNYVYETMRITNVRLSLLKVQQPLFEQSAGHCRVRIIPSEYLLDIRPCFPHVPCHHGCLVSG